MIGSSKNRSSSDSSPTEWCSGNGNRLVSELQLKYQSQQEELEKLKKDLLSQKVIKPSGKVHKSKWVWQVIVSLTFPAVSLCQDLVGCYKMMVLNKLFCAKSLETRRTICYIC